MVKRLISVLALIFVFYVPAFALSDAEYSELKKDPDFMKADKELNQVYKQAQSLMPESEFEEEIKRRQRQWIKSDRDNDAKKLMKQNYSKTEAYTLATRLRAREIYGQIPCDLGLVTADDFIGNYENSNYLTLAIWKDKSKKGIFCVGIHEPGRNSPDMFGQPERNVFEAEFDYNDADLMQILKYENGIDENENLELNIKITMTGKNKIEVEASPDLDRLFNVSGIFIREYD